ncbi:helix-turn-helix transcriptional regulator [Pseudomonas wenzhouensis]|nr:transcriptional regulator [Pseudomonas wenzhouensis]UFQ99113.1 AlpA family phage regulatory protein [Pseudomonas wenzhouensis]
MLSFSEVCSLLRKSRSGLYKLMASDSNFPKPIKDGHARSARSYFAAREIAAYQEAKLAGRDAA